MDASIVRKIARDTLRVDRFDYPRADVLTVAHDNDRSLLVDGRWYSPLIDTIEDDLRARGVECVSVARVISRIKGDLAYGRVYSPEGGFARALVTKRLKGLWARGYPYSKHEERVWARILDRTGARKVLAIQPSRELCVACRERGVWVADVQHGVIGESHPWYGGRFRGQDPVSYLPHAFLCWDEGSRAVIEPWARDKGIHSPVIGNRWVARFVRRAPDDALVQRLLGTFDARTLNPKRLPAVVVALSWGESNIPNGFMVDGLRDAIRATQDRIRWFVRLHPNQLNGFATHEGRKFREFFREYLDGLVEWEAATRVALPLLLAHTDMVVSWASSVSIEAAQMGIPSALLDPRLRAPDDRGDYYEHYRRAGLIDLIPESESSICSWIQAHAGSKGRPENFDAFEAEYRRLLDFLSTR